MIKHIAPWMFLMFALPFVGPFQTLSIGAIWFGLSCVALCFYLWLYGDKLFGNGNVDRLEREEMVQRVMTHLRTNRPHNRIAEARRILAAMQSRRVG